MFRSCLAAATTAVTALALAAGAGPALAAAGWTVVPAPPSGQGGFVTGISVPTATDGWAVGDDGTAAFTDHWNGTTWSHVAIPAFPCTSTRCYVHLFSVSATASDAWVLGAYSPKPGYQALFSLYTTGSGWTATVGTPGTALDDLGPGNVYALDGPFLETWNGSAWTTNYNLPDPPGPAEGDLTTISATSNSDVWIAGSYDPAYSSQSYDNYSLHWNGSTWTEIAMPLPPGSDPLFDYQINAIDAISATNVWAVGESGDNVTHYDGSGGGGTPSGTVIEHYNGTRWSIVSSPATGSVPSLSGVAAISGSNVWAAGTAGGRTLTEHWNGSAWATVASPDPGSPDDLTSISAPAGTGTVWAAGASSSGTLASSNPLVIEHS
jgi:hypothetical protein